LNVLVSGETRDDLQAIELLGLRLQPVQRGGKVGLPDIAVIYHAKRNHAPSRTIGDKLLNFVLRVNCVEMHVLHGQRIHQRQIFTKLAEISGEQQFYAARAEGPVSLSECAVSSGIQLGGEDRVCTVDDRHWH
jgi:hypothetical protein